MQDVFYDEYDTGDSPSGVKRVLWFYLKWGGALLSLMILGLVVLWAYRLGVRDAREIPVIRALENPARVQPSDPGGTQIANQGLEVNEILAGGEAQNPRETALAPANLGLSPDDTPAVLTNLPDGLIADPDEDISAGAAQTEDPQVLDPADEIEALLRQALAEEAGTPEAEEPIAPPDPRPLSRPEELAVIEPQPATEPEPAVDQAPTSGGPGEEVAALAPVVPPPLPSVDPDSLPPGTRLVQLGAFDSEDQAEGQWRRLLGAHTDLLGKRQHFVEEAESNGRIYFRLRAVGFEGENENRSACDALKARAVDCIPVTLR